MHVGCRRIVVLSLLLVICRTIQAQDDILDSNATVDEEDRLDLDILDEILASASSPTIDNELTDSPVSTVPNATNSDLQDAATNTTMDDAAPEGITVKSNLESMTTVELETLCRERGFDVKPDVVGAALTHDDYVKAAKRCLSLDDEINAIIAENPELAAELGDEIERMRAEKERLEAERDALVAQKDALEAKLKKSQPPTRGDSDSASSGSKNNTAESKAKVASRRDDTAAATIPDDTSIESVEEVLRESFVLLFDRVGKDLQLVGGVVRVALKPIGQGIELMWRYTSPTIEGLIRKALVLAYGVLGTDQASLVLRVMSTQWQTMQQVGESAFQTIQVVASTVIGPLSRRPEIRMVLGLVEAFFGPLIDSLTMGWKIMEPDLKDAQAKAWKWLERVIKDANVQPTSRQS